MPMLTPLQFWTQNVVIHGGANNKTVSEKLRFSMSKDQ